MNGKAKKPPKGADAEKKKAKAKAKAKVKAKPKEPGKDAPPKTKKRRPTEPASAPTPVTPASFNGEISVAEPITEASVLAPVPSQTVSLATDEGAEPSTAAEAAASGRRPRRRWRRRVAAATGLVLVAISIAIVLRLVVFQAFSVPSMSMLPTLAVGDRILVDHLAFHPSDLHAGDIVVFRTPAEATAICAAAEGDLVKRIVALPGQVIWSVGSIVYVNGRPLKEAYLAPRTSLGRPISRTRLGPDEFYVLGDNRAVSCDSRFWGPLRGGSIIGKVVMLVWRHGRPDLHLF